MAINIAHIKVTEPQSTITCEVALHSIGDPSNPAVFCVHGLTRNATDFYPLAEQLAEHYYVMMPDVPGRGQSRYLPHPALYNNAFYAFVLAQMLDDKKLNQLRWIGTSMGGLIGMILAATRKDLISTMLINDIGHIIPKEALAHIKTYVGVATHSQNREQLETITRENLAPFGIKDEAILKQFVDHTIIQSEEGGYRLNYDPAIRDGFVEIPDEDADISDIWNLISCPILVFRGEQSMLLPKAIADKMLASKEQIELFEVPDSGHAPSLTTSAEITKVKEFLLQYPTK